MAKIALTLPWTSGGSVTIDPGANPAKSFPADSTFELAKVITQFGNATIYIGAFLMFFWAAWGVFDYIRAEGNKEALAKARKRIQWAIAGFIILLIAFYVSDFIQDSLLSPGGITTRTNQPIQTLTPP